MALVIDPISGAICAASNNVLGRIGAAKDDTAAWAAIFQQAPLGSVVTIPPNMCSIISSPLYAVNQSFSIVNPATVAARPQLQRGGEFVANLPAGTTQPLITLNNCNNCTFEGITLSCDVANYPEIGLLIDTFTDPNGTKLVGVSTANKVKRSCFVTPASTANVHTSVGIGLTASTNNDFMEIEAVFQVVKSSVGGYTAIKGGPSANLYGHRYKASITGAAVGIWMQGGGADIEISGASNQLDCRIANFNAPTYVRSPAGVEQSQMCLQVYNTQSAPLFVSGRWANVQGSTVFDIQTRRLVFHGNLVSAANPATTLAFAEYWNAGWTGSFQDNFFLNKLRDNHEVTFPGTNWDRPF